MNSLEAIILGLIQGLTEFLPVSSSGHLSIGKFLFGIEQNNLTFEVVVHTATVLSTIVVFRKSIWNLVKGLFTFKYNSETEYICKILVSLIPVMIVGLFFKDYVEQIFGSGLLVVGIALFVTSLLLFLSERLSPKNPKPLSYKSAFIMGLAQAVAVIPGLSRSGSTISAGLLCGVDKNKVTEFSFLMVLIPILGESFLQLVSGDLSIASTSIGAMPLLLGFLSAFLSGLFACKVMISIVRKAKLSWFAIYCLIAALFSIVCHFIG